MADRCCLRDGDGEAPALPERCPGCGHPGPHPSGEDCEVARAVEDVHEDHACEECGSRDGVEFGPNPYAEELYGDGEPHWICGDCREELAADV